MLTKSDNKLGFLIDPDRHSAEDLGLFVEKVTSYNPDILLVGSSIIVNSSVENSCAIIKSKSALPLVLFPGHFSQLNANVDGVLLLSLISGRNPDLLIGQHVLAAPWIKKLGINCFSTGYMLIDGGCTTSVSYISNTTPIPRSKIDIAVSTAMAAELIGMKQVYLDAGSGAEKRVSIEMIKAVAEAVDIPVIVGGGIKTKAQVKSCFEAGANLVVIGNALEDSTAQF